MAKKLPEPQVKLNPKKAVPYATLDTKLKDILKLKGELIKERAKVVNEANKKVIEINRKLDGYDGSMTTIRELMEFQKEVKQDG